MNPSIGRIVIYQNLDDEKQLQYGAESVPAVIVRVHSRSVVNLAIFVDNSAVTMRKTSVEFGGAQGHWRWPVIEK
ncbi:MAG: hypothetical protein ACRD4V_07665 [Candidatus Acidiferrales bacterium]